MSAPLFAAGALAGLQIWSGLQEAEMIRRNARIQAQIDEMNAKYAELDAYKTEVAGESEIAAYQPVIDQTIGEQKTAFAAQDVDINFGTAADLINETKLTGFLNQLKLRQEARARAMGFRAEARQTRLGSQMRSSQADMSAASATTSGYVSAAATGLSAYARNK